MAKLSLTHLVHIGFDERNLPSFEKRLKNRFLEIKENTGKGIINLVNFVDEDIYTDKEIKLHNYLGMVFMALSFISYNARKIYDKGTFNGYSFCVDPRYEGFEGAYLIMQEFQKKFQYYMDSGEIFDLLDYNEVSKHGNRLERIMFYLRHFLFSSINDLWKKYCSLNIFGFRNNFHNGCIPFALDNPSRRQKVQDMAVSILGENKIINSSYRDTDANIFSAYNYVRSLGFINIGEGIVGINKIIKGVNYLNGFRIHLMIKSLLQNISNHIETFHEINQFEIESIENIFGGEYWNACVHNYSDVFNKGFHAFNVGKSIEVVNILDDKISLIKVGDKSRNDKYFLNNGSIESGNMFLGSLF